jgi:hypothetical protein
MIAKPKRFGTAFMAIIYGLTVLVPALAVILSSSGTASASSEQYLFYYDKSKVSEIKKAFGNSSPLSPLTSSGLNDTSVAAQGGAFGSQHFAFTFNSNPFNPVAGGNGALNVTYTSNSPLTCAPFKTPPAASSDWWIWNQSLSPPYVISLPLIMTVPLDKSSITSGLARQNFVNGTLSIDTGNATLSDSAGDTPLSFNDIATGTQASMSSILSDIIPSGCMPAGFNPSSNSAGYQLPKYVALADKSPWKWVQSSTDINNADSTLNNPPPTGPSPGNASSNLSCTLKWDNPLTWVICPVVDALTGIASGVDSLITQQMDIKTGTIFCGSATCGAYYSAWQAFRDIALGLLVVAGLIIVISEALGMEILDAYTIKKTLPRLLVAAIGITISWPLMNFAVNASDILGYGVRHLIYYPFTQIHNAPDLTFGGNAIEFFFGAGAVAGGTLAAIPIWIAFGGLGALISLAATAALAVGVAILVLILRQIVIILLILVSPIAIVAYILPRTQQMYKFWWSNFSRALLMFPMIAAMIATGRVFAAVTFSRPGVINQFIGFIAYFAPYFMIPMTFKLSGALMGQIGGMVQNRAQGGFKALSEQRKRRSQERIKAAQTGGLYRNDHRLGRFANRVGNYSIDIGDSGSAFLGTKRGLGWAFGRKGRILENKIAEQRVQHSQKAEQQANLHYSTGRALAGLHHYALDEFVAGENADGSLKFKEDEHGSTAKAEAGYNKMHEDLQNHFGVEDASSPDGWAHDEDGHQIFRAADGEKDALELGKIYSSGWGQNSHYAAAELQGKAAMLGSFKGAGNEETQRADLETVGLLAAAKAGRLENSEISGTQGRATGVKGGFAVTRENLLRDAATQKRVEQARGHGTVYERGAGGTMTSTDVYKNPLSAEAQKSFMRISAQELASGKSEAIDALRETMIVAASPYEMEMKDGKLVPQKDKNNKEILKTDKVRADQATAAQERIRYIASYAVGDSDVGRKVMSIAGEVGMDTKTLGFGGRSASPDMLNPQQPEGPQMPDLGAGA